MIYVAHEKHGTFTYESALRILADRTDEGYWYDNWDDGNPRHQWEDRARKILAARETHSPEAVERAAWRFLSERSDHEYEYVERQEVRR